MTHSHPDQGLRTALDPNPAIDASEGTPLTVDYINYRGERGTRHILPGRIVYGATEYHPRHQWLLEAFDLDKGAMRVFAMEDMQFLKPPTMPPAQAPDKAAEREGLKQAVSKALHDNQFFDDWNELVDPVVEAVLALAPQPNGTEASRPVGANGLLDTLEYIADLAEKPTYNSLEVGFRHSPLTASEEKHRLVECCEHIAQVARSALATTLTPTQADSTGQGDGARETEDAYIARVRAMSSDEIRAEAEAVGVDVPQPRSLPESLRNLRFRLEAALANRLEEGDREAIAWLNDGVITIGAVLASLPASATPSQADAQTQEGRR